jgi:hypothetical protein
MLSSKEIKKKKNINFTGGYRFDEGFRNGCLQILNILAKNLSK